MKRTVDTIWKLIIVTAAGFVLGYSVNSVGLLVNANGNFLGAVIYYFALFLAGTFATIPSPRHWAWAALVVSLAGPLNKYFITPPDFEFSGWNIVLNGILVELMYFRLETTVFGALLVYFAWRRWPWMLNKHLSSK